MTSDLRDKINWKNSIYKDYLKNGKTNYHYIKLQYAISEVSAAISKGKDEYHRRLAQKLSDPSASSKTYWSILKRFYNGKKVPIIPPLLINNKLESDFKTKANYFNSFFASKCTPLINNSTLPNSLQYVSAARLSSFSFNEEVILKIINALNINKVHGHDDISIRMIKLCSKSVVKPLSIIFKNCIDTGTFPDIWKRSNIIPVHKKGDKQIVDNYRPVSLLPIFGKILEKLLFNSIMDFLEENNLLNSNQSGFRSNDSCESQLLSIVHDIYSSFDCYPSLEVRVDISKAFDRVWHEGLIYKIQSTRISGTPLKLIKSFLSGRFQSVLLNGRTSSWSQILAGVPQDSILGPLFCLIYINDLGNNLSSTVKQFADHKFIFSIVHDIDLSSKQLNDDLKKASDWAYHWKMSFNPDLSKQAQEVIFSRKSSRVDHPVVTFNNSPVAQTL